MNGKTPTNMKYGKSEYVGQKFNRLTVIGISKELNGKYIRWMWTCRCDCGNVKKMRGDYVATGHSKSCGCARKENKPFFVHGESGTRLHMIWNDMRHRCFSDDASAGRYRDRGITVCEEWLEYKNFAKWARENGYNDMLSIERIDNDGNYCPENCKWIERGLQARNRGTTYWVEWNGRKMSLAEACEIEKMPYKQVFSRIKYCGWPVDKALTTPIQKFGMFDHRKGARAYEKK